MGATGLVGSHVAEALSALGPVDRTGLTRHAGDVRELDVRDEDAVTRTIRELAPDVVVCAAAEAFVERCEREPLATSAINVRGVATLARAAASRDAGLVFFSSDYVFDGERAPYVEEDAVGPINEYGRQKVAAERLVRSQPRNLVCRVSGVFGVEPRRKNFVYQVVDRLRSGDSVRAANDQVLCPTPAVALGEAVARLITLGAHGVVHVTGPDALTRAEFARRVARAFGLDESGVIGLPTSELGLIAKRPRDSSLRCDRLRSYLGHELPSTDDALRRLAVGGLG